MDCIVDLAEIVAHEIADEAALGIYDAETYFFRDDTKRTYSFVTVPHANPQKSLIVMLACVTAENPVVIETDHTDRPLYKALIDAGVPRSQIIRAYVGKTEPAP